MSYVLKKALSHRSNYGSARNTSNIWFFVVHFTANDGDTDEANARYFQNNIVKASANYFIDDDSITESVPDNYVAWAVGGAKYSDCSTTGGGSMYGKIMNSNSLSFEMCDTQRNGVYNVSNKTRANAIAFIAKKMVQYGITIDKVYRHFDVNGKMCPKYYSGKSNEAAWKKFKEDLNKEYQSLKKPSKPATSNTSTTTTKPVTTKKKVTIAKPTLKKGSTGAQVKILQENLNALGYKGKNGKKLTVDGDFGANTVYALQAFQKAKKLSVDAIYGANTQKAMDKALNG